MPNDHRCKLTSLTGHCPSCGSSPASVAAELEKTVLAAADEDDTDLPHSHLIEGDPSVVLDDADEAPANVE